MNISSYLYLKIKKDSALAFVMIIYGKIKRLMKSRLCKDSNPKLHRHSSDCLPLSHNHMLD